MLCAIIRRPALAAAKMGEARLAAKGWRRPPVKMTVPRPSGTRRRAASRPTRKPAETSDAPELLEQLRGELRNRLRRVVAGVEHDEVGGRAVVAAVIAPVEQTARRRPRVASVATASARPPSRDRSDHLLDLVRRPPATST